MNHMSVILVTLQIQSAAAAARDANAHGDARHSSPPPPLAASAAAATAAAAAHEGGTTGLFM